MELGEEIEPPQRDAEQEPQSLHSTTAFADARPGLGEVELEAAEVLSTGGLGRPNRTQ
jgi:hypothetical protein